MIALMVGQSYNTKVPLFTTKSESGFRFLRSFTTRFTESESVNPTLEPDSWIQDGVHWTNVSNPDSDSLLDYESKSGFRFSVCL